MSNPATPLRREFTVDRSILASIIKAQSGTVEKALVELLTNAVDAGATKLDITLTQQGFTVADDGSGFASIAVFDEFFGRFGFDHSMLDRTYGRFGIGRGQVMALAKTQWRTADFSAHVDIETEGYGYTITPDLEPIVGLTVIGEFYKPLDGVALYHAVTAFSALVRYAPIPVTLNGTLVNELSNEKWDEETPEALIRVNRSNTLDVYSQGILVEKIYANRYGCGGVVVTKRGFALQQNMARAQLLTANCTIWPGIEKVVKRLAKQFAEADAKRAVETDATRAARVAELMAAGTWEAMRELMDGKLITLTDGRHVTLRSVAQRKIWTTGEDRTKPAEDLHRSGAAAVLSIRTLDRFGVSTVADLLRRLLSANWGPHRSLREYLKLDTVEAIESIEDVPGFQNPSYQLLTVKELTAPQKVGLSISQRVSDELARVLRKKRRRLVPGRSAFAEAWTDGATYIAVEEHRLAAAQADGVSGWMRMVHLLLHEYLHDAASNLSHAHSMEFYETFHEHCFENSDHLTRIAVGAFRYHCKRGKASPAKLSTLAWMFDVDERVGLNDLPPPVEYGLAEKDANPPR